MRNAIFFVFACVFSTQGYGSIDCELEEDGKKIAKIELADSLDGATVWEYLEGRDEPNEIDVPRTEVTVMNEGELEEWLERTDVSDFFAEHGIDMGSITSQKKVRLFNADDKTGPAVYLLYRDDQISEKFTDLYFGLFAICR